MTTLLKNDDVWIIHPKPNPHARIRLFCFPYAGGNAAIYRDWSSTLPDVIDVCAVQLPGRTNRIGEPPFRHMADLLEALTSALMRYFAEPFVFFGHSMGALVSFELARHLRRQCDFFPLHLFLSGRRAVQVPAPTATTYRLPDDAFIAHLDRLNGIPQTVRHNTELMQLVLPTLRADVELCETYTYVDEAPLNCGITALSGQDDVMVSRDDAAAWREQTDSAFKLRILPGDHFFLHSAQSQVLQIVSDDLLRLLRWT